MLKPDENTHKFLISSTSRFVGEYENETLLITHAWPSVGNMGQLYASQTENPYSRNYFIIVFKSELCDKGARIGFPDYEWFPEFICIYLSILFGKRFDNHGPLETNGFFYLANPNVIVTGVKFFSGAL